MEKKPKQLANIDTKTSIELALTISKRMVFHYEESAITFVSHTINQSHKLFWSRYKKGELFRDH